MNALSVADFEKYFRELHGHPPYSWQQRLAERAIAGNWPGAIDLPTGSGKTACIDIAIFALACQASQGLAERTAPTRVFFCVNRRVIVGEAYQRSRRIAKKILEAERGELPDARVLREVSAALRRLTGSRPKDDAPPLDVLELRGGIYRDNRWARSATQPTIICTTIDQLGSRLLFRGYGVTDNAAPIQAALVAYDSLILLDEAHISTPFFQTLQNVRRYLDPEKWAECSLGVEPVRIVPMTATRPENVAVKDVIDLDKEERKNEADKPLNKRLTASKQAKLVDVKSIIPGIVDAAKTLAKGKPTAVGVIVNRVATARSVYEKLKDLHPEADVQLVIGSMRPIDREKQSVRLREIVGPGRPEVAEQTSFVVATQCLEVGADYDFDALVTECASLDALRQRFGRLNRAGRDINAQAVILIEKKSIKAEDKLKADKVEDPIYGNALARTWNWMSPLAADEVVDFGIDAFNSLLAEHGEDHRIPLDLLAPSARLDAPVMLPAYIDFWCQTSPRPAPNPDVSLFLHGQQRCAADVQVCWRGDLIEDDAMSPDEHWCDVVALVPPTSAECMTVPLSRLRRWLAQEKPDGNEGDLLGVSADEEENGGKKKSGQRPRSERNRRAVLWRGAKDSKFVILPQDLRELRPGDTLVFPEAEDGGDTLGHIPRLTERGENGQGPRIDVAEAAFRAARDRATLRVHPSLLSGGCVEKLLERVADRESTPTHAKWRVLLKAAHETASKDEKDIKEALSFLIDRDFTCEPYPDRRGVAFTTRKRLRLGDDWFLPSLDDGDDLSSRTQRKDPILLTDHTNHVVTWFKKTRGVLPLPTDVAGLLLLAVELHDLGKADKRFQAMLLRETATDAYLHAELIAKSGGLPRTRKEQKAARQRAGLPDGFRHEMLSVQLAQQMLDVPDDLVLHLIAAHHGYARPFAPVVVDDAPLDVKVNGVSITGDERRDSPSHRIDSGVAERFWSLTRHFGWWGLAYLESLLRLADQQASADEDSGELTNAPNETIAETPA